MARARKASAPVRQFPTVRQYMTGNPFTIARGDSLAAAHALMRKHQVRHLPVVDGSIAVGLLSQRDVLHVLHQLLERG